MPRLATLAFFVGLATTVFAQGVTTNRWPPSWPPSYSNNTFEYIVVGSGAGGGPLASRLARAGHSVLLIEAGNDQGTDTNYTVPAFQAAVAADPKLRWDFYVNHYPTLDRAQRDPHYVYQLSNGTQYVGLTPPSGAKPLGILYPRAGTLGGCISHNALVWIHPHASDWNTIANATGDQSWAAPNMMQYLNKSMEWVTSELVDPDYFQNDAQYAQQIDAGAQVMGRGPSRASPLSGFDNLFQTPNSLAPGRDAQEGFFGVPLITKNGARNGVRERIVDTVMSGYPLTVRMNSFVTKINFDTSRSTPRATGVQFLDGQYLYSASPMSGHTTGTPGSAIATREVIIAGGVYNSVQLLKLSGIGPQAELSSFGIKTLVNLPGVGTNMQDRYEVPVNVIHQKNFTIQNGCTYTGTSSDACYQQWVNNPSNVGTTRGEYVSNGIAASMGVNSDYADNSDLDLFIFAGAFNFRGYFPGWPQATLPDHLHFSWYALKAHARNTAGTVKLRSANPLDTPIINFNYFDTGTTTNGADTKDLGALVQAVHMARQALANYTSYSSLGGSPFVEQSPGPNVTSDADLQQFIKDHAWGHHASCTNKIGGDSDPNAVLDSQFRVRGTAGLRVVDASAFPKIPGIFVQAPIIMLSEKAADTILGSTGAPHWGGWGNGW